MRGGNDRVRTTFFSAFLRNQSVAFFTRYTGSTDGSSSSCNGPFQFTVKGVSCALKRVMQSTGMPESGENARTRSRGDGQCVRDRPVAARRPPPRADAIHTLLHRAPPPKTRESRILPPSRSRWYLNAGEIALFGRGHLQFSALVRVGSRDARSSTANCGASPRAQLLNRVERASSTIKLYNTHTHNPS